MSRTKKEVIDSTAGNADGIESGQENAGNPAYVNGVEVSGFTDEPYANRSTDAGTLWGSPDDSSTAAPSPAPGKKRGRPAGGKNRAKTSAASTVKVDLAIDKLTNGVAFIHCTLANMLKVPELEMGVEEAGTVVTASVDVLSQYDLTPDPKTAAWLNLTMVLATVYGMRVMAYQTRMKLAKNQTVETNA